MAHFTMVLVYQKLKLVLMKRNRNLNVQDKGRLGQVAIDRKKVWVKKKSYTGHKIPITTDFTLINLLNGKYSLHFLLMSS